MVNFKAAVNNNTVSSTIVKSTVKAAATQVKVKSISELLDDTEMADIDLKSFAETSNAHNSTFPHSELLAKAQRGDEDALAMLLQHYQDGHTKAWENAKRNGAESLWNIIACKERVLTSLNKRAYNWLRMIQVETAKFKRGERGPIGQNAWSDLEDHNVLRTAYTGSHTVIDQIRSINGGGMARANAEGYARVYTNGTVFEIALMNGTEEFERIEVSGEMVHRLLVTPKGGSQENVPFTSLGCMASDAPVPNMDGVKIVRTGRTRIVDLNGEIVFDSIKPLIMIVTYETYASMVTLVAKARYGLTGHLEINMGLIAEKVFGDATYIPNTPMERLFFWYNWLLSRCRTDDSRANMFYNGEMVKSRKGNMTKRYGRLAGLSESALSDFDRFSLAMPQVQAQREIRRAAREEERANAPKPRTSATVAGTVAAIASNVSRKLEEEFSDTDIPEQMEDEDFA